MFNQRTRAKVGLVLAALLTASAAACSGDPEPEDEVGGTADLTVFAPEFPEQNLKGNLYTKKLEKKFNINFTFQTTATDPGPAKEKRQIALASGDYPDLFLLVPWVDQFTAPEVMKFGQQGVAIPLNDLIEEHAPNIKKALEENPDFQAMATAPDGNIYGLPQWVDCYHCSYAGKLWMNSQWLENVGLEQPTTTEELREVLRAFKTEDPNGNGKADEVALSANVRDTLIPYLMDPFIYNPQGQSPSRDSTVVLNNGKVDIQANKDGWREGLKYIKSLYDEGLIDKGAFTQNPEALQQLGDNANTVILGSAVVMHPGIFVSIGQEDKRDTQYDAVPPVTGPTGVGYASYTFPSVPGATFVLTNKATKNDQVAAIKMLDYIFTDEGQISGSDGKKGLDWAWAEEGDVALNPDADPLYKTFEELPEKEAETVESRVWGALVQYNNGREFRDRLVQPMEIYTPAGYERRLQEATTLYEGKEAQDQIYPYWGVWIDPAEASEVASLQTNIESYTTRNTLAFITGSKDIDTEWDAYVAGFDGLGLPRYLEILQAAYEKSDVK
ncbi:extracellular solute-binding protein [Actinopolymorpha sp. B9G3]|uniref:extracellular solute-binding protein n=1 Tax=Actinopolymorpha sp. B9G3 TaxID=3158970 RepID=UPI0032D909ED